jgi:hypothetical protein
VAPCLSWCFSGVQRDLSGLKSINGGMAQMLPRESTKCTCITVLEHVFSY